MTPLALTKAGKKSGLVTVIPHAVGSKKYDALFLETDWTAR